MYAIERHRRASDHLSCFRESSTGKKKLYYACLKRKKKLYTLVIRTHTHMCMYMYLYVYMHTRRDTLSHPQTRMYVPTHIHNTRTLIDTQQIHIHTLPYKDNFITKDMEGKRKQLILSSQISSVLNSVRRNVHFFRVMRKIDRKFSVTKPPVRSVDLFGRRTGVIDAWSW